MKKYLINNSNTTFVKVKLSIYRAVHVLFRNSNTTFVKVKLSKEFIEITNDKIQIQHLLKLNYNIPPLANVYNIFKYNIC